MTRLILHNISKFYDHNQVVQNVSLEFEKGEFIALLGPSGCGKTTLLRMIAGFEPVSEGEIRFGSKILSSATPYKQVHIPPEKREISMVFQSYALWPHMHVDGNVGYALKLKGIKGQEYKSRVHDALKAVNLENFADRYPNELSGGQRQRVALARCLVSTPKIVLLDEPLANLDQHLRGSMERTFREFQRKTGATFIYVTHDQAEAMALADKIAVMNAGRVEQFDTPENLYNKPLSEWVARFIGKGSILNLPSIGGNILVRPQHVHVRNFANLQVVVKERIFKGAHYAYHADLEDGQEILFYSEDLIDIGSRIGIELEKYSKIS
ncbi:ABC transporter related [Taylorella equigenitalis 14/56]|uniref:ABC transporter related n=1 Tax=Taylorella equigenitalis 14/56 TaxID=1091497 RepID=I7JKS7_9BURK|nr:ABC transporter ATP-binding protein [Taylorella equigenitalis]ASY42397.1 ABC transporter ATP-binding protein [Taylorella equigenitalis]WDU47347.1 ABC transporter ATP-binding protein [Taylorella equigenitalis]WDU48812.1 ABC transporter ATP-binding protein [Taylorella equigenitalis]WDU51288.1 ABC transporter ATP-binding protein [Taylorella equigenitalis]WDU54305.1 ABC transporter ATP-binding protein [Taylorella equigenitalis]